MGGILRIFFSKIQFLKKVTRSTLGGEMHVDALWEKLKIRRSLRSGKRERGGGNGIFSSLL